MPFSADDFEFMAHALRLGERGLYTTTPNPRVGCVLVKDAKSAHILKGENDCCALLPREEDRLQGIDVFWFTRRQLQRKSFYDKINASRGSAVT